DIVNNPVITNKDIVNNPVLTNKDIVNNPVITNKDIVNNPVITNKDIVNNPVTTNKDIKEKAIQTNPILTKGQDSVVENFRTAILQNQLEDEQMLLIYYMKSTSKYALGERSRLEDELRDIKEWQKIHSYNDCLYNNYSSCLRNLKMRNFLKETDFTSYGNPKEFTLVDELQPFLLNMPYDLMSKINEAITRTQKKEEKDEEFNWPF
ncbi:MAG: hypothetical protein N4A37_00410, partial [Prolixibacteraceae bacterium]|nr:hypothetical protein [Prolixibacteraceae bacterium]